MLSHMVCAFTQHTWYSLYSFLHLLSLPVNLDYLKRLVVIHKYITLYSYSRIWHMRAQCMHCRYRLKIGFINCSIPHTKKLHIRVSYQYYLSYISRYVSMTSIVFKSHLQFTNSKIDHLWLRPSFMECTSNACKIHCETHTCANIHAISLSLFLPLPPPLPLFLFASLLHG